MTCPDYPCCGHDLGGCPVRSSDNELREQLRSCSIKDLISWLEDLDWRPDPVSQQERFEARREWGMRQRVKHKDSCFFCGHCGTKLAEDRGLWVDIGTDRFTVPVERIEVPIQDGSGFYLILGECGCGREMIYPEEACSPPDDCPPNC